MTGPLQPHIQQMTNNLIRYAEQCGYIITIETVPQQPLAMGNVKMVGEVRVARHRTRYEPAPNEGSEP